MVELDAWDVERIAYYKEQIAIKMEATKEAGEEGKDALLEDIRLFEDVVRRMEDGAPPPKPIEQKQYYIEPEDEGCEGGACKI